MATIERTSPASFPTILDEKFSANVANEDYVILRALKLLHSGEHVRHVALLENANCPTFPLSAFLHKHDVKVEIMDDPRHEVVSWNAHADASRATAQARLIDSFGGRPEKGELITQLFTGAMKFTYCGTDFLVYKCSWHRERSRLLLYDIVFEDKGLITESDPKDLTTTAGHSLVTDVFRWAGALKDEIWVFQDGGWSKDKALWNAIRNASWDDVVLEEEFLQNLRRDTHTFFQNRQIYTDLGVTWKRGILLLGPPGNGKTESIKVLLNESGQAALYVKSFTTQMGPEFGVKQIFDHARSNAPCILVIEDLDSLVTSGVRSFFLNELDGLAKNEGVLTIATTNHPERIDDSILNRPSRFDVKYDFALPTEALRKTYSEKWIRKINALPSREKYSGKFTKTESELAEEVAKSTEGWSFAFLKELFVSFLLRVAHDKARGRGDIPSSADDVLLSQIATLSSQIKVSLEKYGVEGDDATGNASGARVIRPRMAVIPQSVASLHPGSNF